MPTDHFLRVLWRRRLSFVLTFLLVIAGVAAVTFILPKVYSTETFVLVSGTRGPATDYEATQTNQVLTKTYAELLQTRNVANSVAVALPYPSSGAKVQSSVDIAPVSGTQLIRIAAEGSTRTRAQSLANTYARVFVAQPARFGGASLRTGQVAVAQLAPRPADPSRPKPKLYLIVGALLAAFAGTAIALLRQRVDQRLVVEPSTTELHGLSILARVPQQRNVGDLVTATDGSYERSQVSEAFGLLLANLAFANLGHRPRSLAVVSSTPGEGKSTTALSIGRAAMEAGVDVVVVDADLRRPSVAAMLSASQRTGAPGLSSLLVSPDGQALLEVAVDSLGMLPNIIPSGPLPPNPAALLASGGLRELNRRLQEEFALVVYDTPPVSVGADASLVASSCEAVVIVVDASKTKRDSLLRAVDQLHRTEANLIGIVMNKVSGGRADYGYQGPRETGRDSERSPRGRSGRNSASGEKRGRSGRNSASGEKLASGRRAK